MKHATQVEAAPVQTSLGALRAVPLFTYLSDHLFETLAGNLKLCSFAQGQVVVEEGQRGDAFYVIAEGEFQVYLRHDSLGFEKELSRLEPGQYFGEISVLSGHPRSASVRASQPSQAWVMSRPSLMTLLEQSPVMVLALCQRLATMVATANRELSAIPLVDLQDYPRVSEFQTLLPPRVSVLCQAVAIDRKEKRVKVALVDPGNEGVRTFVRSVLRQSLMDVEFVALRASDFERVRAEWLEPSALLELESADLSEMTFQTSEGGASISERTGEAALFEKFLSQAILSGASDIHIEPTPTGGRVRLRVDGLLFPLPETLTVKQMQQLASRIKILFEMDITVKRLPQDGHLTVNLQNRRIYLRGSVIPCQGGEKIVLRLLDPLQRKVELDALIPSRAVVAMMREMFLEPSGLLLVCGPTGSGKTTTLYAGLNEIWKQSSTVNIMTIEDPVEYQIEFAAQVSVNRAIHLDFPQILRTVLRQDPDIILVGEIRDEESAIIALEAATSGHLVLSSLHTDQSLESIARLRQLGAKPYMIAAGLRGVVCQQLVSRVCQHCSEPVPASDAEWQRLLRQDIFDEPLTRTPRRGRGCQVCQFRGERGRVPVVELLVIDDAIRGLIEENAPSSQMQDCLNPSNFVSMARFGRHVLEAGLVAPERIREIFPSKSLAIR